jgi:hypothetical protein
MNDPSPPPPWDPAASAQSLARYGAWLNETARSTFLSDKTHVELFFLVLPDGQIALGNAPPGMNRQELVGRVKQAVQDNNIYGVVHVMEAWTYIPRGPNDHTYKQVLAGEMKVAELKPEDRTEALVVRMEGRDGAHHLWINPIRRLADGVALDPAVEMDHPVRGQMASFFPPDDTARRAQPS